MRTTRHWRTRLIISLAVLLVGALWGAVIGGAFRNPAPLAASRPEVGARTLGLQTPVATVGSPTAPPRPAATTAPTETARPATTPTVAAGDPPATLLPTAEATATPPPTATVEPPAAGPQTYTIQEGDILYRIARRFGVSLEDLQRANPGVDPNGLQIGQTIVIPPPPTPGG
ncbi:MAG TPA: hypothetical protein DEP84_14175 [Chloroflexi bacterium]|nr:hypothetical protein [Chloroflexota bacterium]